MFALIAAVISGIVSLFTKGMGIQREQQAAITEGYVNDRGFEQGKTLAYFNIQSEKERAALIIIGILAIGVFVVGAIIVIGNKKK